MGSLSEEVNVRIGCELGSPWLFTPILGMYYLL